MHSPHLLEESPVVLSLPAMTVLPPLAAVLEYNGRDTHCVTPSADRVGGYKAWALSQVDLVAESAVLPAICHV